MTLCDLEWPNQIFNDTRRRFVSLRQLSFLLTCGIEWLHTARFSCWHHVRPSASQLQAGTEAMQLNTDQPVYAIK